MNHLANKVWGFFAFMYIVLIVSACQKSEGFSKVVLIEGMDEPMAMTFLPDNRILFVERKGAVKILDQETRKTKLAGTISVSTKYTDKEGVVSETEEGIMGVVVHPEFEKNPWVYLYYADPVEPKHVLARYELNGSTLVEESRKILLVVPIDRGYNHTGGGMVFDKEGNLYLTVGNNTENPKSGTSSLDERPGHEGSDDQRASGNTNDLRGKILRIHPENDGTYTIPKGNLFPVGTEKTRPEIYTMGHRNPWRVSLDSETGYLYWGEIGPDADYDSIGGSRGYDEFNQAKGPGFFGWPYFIGDNQPYTRHDFFTGTYGEPFDVNNPVNESVNNTGLRELPTPVMPAMIWYPYDVSEDFPLLESSSRSATGGPVFRRKDFAKDAPFVFPEYYEGKWLIVDFMRGWIMSVSMDENGDYKSMERFLPEETFSSAIDMDFGPDGALYILEYGEGWFKRNRDSRIVKIEYNRGNRKPNVIVSADKLAGAIPFTANFSSAGTNDEDYYDKGKLTYNWAITSVNGAPVNLNGADVSYTFETPGIYKVLLTVIDTEGQSNSASLEVVAGNDLPEVSIDFKGKNRTFYFGDKSLEYKVIVTDKEDGSTSNGAIKPEEVAVTFDYVPSGFDPIQLASKQIGVETNAVLSIGRNLIEASDCKSCHQYDSTSVGPSYAAVAKKYPNNPENVSMLVSKIIKGGSGVWGDYGMSAHPQLSEADAKRMVDYIFSLNEVNPNVASLPLEGKLSPEIPEDEDGQGGYLLRAFYSDKGSGNIRSLVGEDFVALRNPFLDPILSEVRKGVQLSPKPNVNFFMVGDQSYIGFIDLDMTGIKEITFYIGINASDGAKGASVEVRLDSPTGKLLGKTEKVTEAPEGEFKLTKGASRADLRRRYSAKPSTAISAVTGKHDIYFVFKNPDARSEDILVSVNKIEFKN
jgi:cytochrome c